jgi:formamidopyrimidine-DNA glycosylase
LIDLDEHNRLLAEAKKSEMTFFGRVLDMLKCSRINHLNKHRTKGEPARESDWPMSFTTTGKEWKVKGKVIKRGEKYEVTPQDLDGEYIRTIEPIDNRQSTQNARIDLAAKRRAMGTLLWDEYVEMNGVENVTEFNEKMAEEMLFQLGVPQAIMETRVQVAQITALINDTTVEEVLIGMPEEVVPQITDAVAPGGTGTMRMATPQTEGIGTMGNSGSMT